MPERTCGAVVETVRVAVPEPFATELGLNEQVGAGEATGVMLPQDKLMVPLKEFIGVMVIVEVRVGSCAGEAFRLTSGTSR